MICEMARIAVGKQLCWSACLQEWQHEGCRQQNRLVGPAKTMVCVVRSPSSLLSRKVSRVFCAEPEMQIYCYATIQTTTYGNTLHQTRACTPELIPPICGHLVNPTSNLMRSYQMDSSVCAFPHELQGFSVATRTIRTRRKSER